MLAGSRLETEVCIVGAGPAGLTLAAELAGGGVGVIVLEAGGSRAEAGPDFEFSSEDFESPAMTRSTGIGGMAGQWSNDVVARRFGIRLLPLDTIDFEARDWLPHSGWPFGRQVLDPYYQRARVQFGLHSPPPAVALQTPASIGDAVTTSLTEHGGQEAFTRDLPRALERSNMARLVTRASAVRVTTADGGARAGAVVVRSPNGAEFEVRARAFVLAGGAIENARLLLASTDRGQRGPGNDGDQVGRYYMDHLYIHAGVLHPSERPLTRRLAPYDIQTVAGAPILGKLQLTEAVRRREQLLNATLELLPRVSERERRAVRVLRPLASGDRSLESTLRAVPVLARMAASALPLAVHQRTLSPTLEYGWSLPRIAPQIDAFDLLLQVEQAPDPSNRVTLAGDRADDGQPRAHLAWHWSAIDVASVNRTRTILASELERSGIGRVELAPTNPPRLWHRHGTHHHLGTTRMHVDPAQGVVDPDLRVHGMANLFVAGGSVFPTGGHANPTLTLVALSIRLADHLRTWLGGSAAEHS